MKPVTAWDFHRFRAALGLRQGVAGIDLERCVELPWCFNRLIERPPRRMLDVGSRNSVFPIFASWKTGASVTAIDLDPMIVEQRAMTLRLAAKTGLDPAKVEYKRMDATRLEFDDSSFDTVTAVSMLEHIPEVGGDSAALREIHRALEPGGRLLLTVPAFREYRIITAEKTVYDREYDHEPVFFERVYDEEAIEKRLLSAAPFRVIEKTFFGQPFYDFSLLWWTRLPFVVKVPVRWATPLMAAAFYRRVDSPRESKGLTLACLALEK